MQQPIINNDHDMKNIKYLAILLLAVAYTQCSPKVADEVASTTKTVKVNADPALAWRSSAPEPGPARAIELGEYNSFTLDNGLKVIVVENHKLPRVSYQLTLANDPILEGEQAGYVSMAGDLMATGTKTRTKAELDADIDFIGARLSSSSSGMFASSLKKHGDKLLDLMTDVLYNPSFPEAEFEKLKKQTISGLESDKTDPNSMAANTAAVLNYGSDHPYGEVVTLATIEKIKLEQCKQYYNTYFKPNNAYLIIVGDIEGKEAKAQAEQYFGQWHSGEVPQPTYSMPQAPSETKVSIANKDGAVQSVIRVTYPVDLQPGADDLVKARVMNNILGGGIFSGRLMQNLREDKAYTYGARSQLSSDDLVGSFNAYASVRNEVTDSSVTEFMYELRRLRDEPISAEDLALVKSSMTGSFGRSLESPQTMARFALNTFRYDLPKDYYQTYLQRLDAVTIADVQAMAQKYIRPDNANIIVVGSADDIADKLLQFDADGEIDYFDAFGMKVEMDKAALPEGVTGESVVMSYLEAIGGADKLKAVKTMVRTGSMEMMGQQATLLEQYKSPNMYSSQLSLGGNMMQQQVYDGAKAMVGQMGQSQVLTEGEMYEQTKESAVMFSQLNYIGDDYSLELKGLEDVDGAKAYKVEVADSKGDKSYEYYDVKSGLLVKTMSTTPGPDGSESTVSSIISDYKAVNGVMMPYKMVLSGLMPMPLTMTVTDIKIDSDISDEVFMVK